MSFCLHSIQNIQHIIWNECYWVTACYSQMIPLVPRNSMSQWCLFIYLFFSRNTLLEPTCDSWKHAWINKCYFDHPLSRWWISWGREMGFVQQHLDAWLRAPLVLVGFAATLHNFIRVKANAVCWFLKKTVCRMRVFTDKPFRKSEILFAKLKIFPYCLFM